MSGVDHELECALAAYGVLIERAERDGRRNEAKAMKREEAEIIKAAKAKLRSDLTEAEKAEALRIGRIEFASAGASRKK